MSARFETELVELRPGPLGARLCVWHLPQASVRPRSLIVHVHAFAEEMNKSRRMVALQSRALAAEGHLVLLVDLLGCGDSAGDFGAATWGDWVADITAAVQLAQQRVARDWPDAEAPTLWLWGHRLGCLLATQAAAGVGPCNLLFWQPAPAGKALLQQFLRLDSIAGKVGKAGAAGPGAKELLAAGQAAEVAGYVVAPALASGMDAARLDPISASTPARLVWLEVRPQPATEPSPVARQLLSDWAAAGWRTQMQMVQGSSFWQTTEIEEATELLSATSAALAAEGPARAHSPQPLSNRVVAA